MAENSLEGSNPIAFVYKGEKVRRYPEVLVRVDQITMRELIDASEETGMSFREIIGYSARPCECCMNKGVTVYDKSDKPKQIKRGIMSKRIPKHD